MSFKTKPFNLQEALAGKPVVTRNGKKVLHIHDTGYDNLRYPVVSIIEGHTSISSHAIDGAFVDTCTERDLDLFMLVEPEVAESYHNVYKDKVGMCQLSIESAIKAAKTATSVCKLTITDGEVTAFETVHRYNQDTQN